MIKLFINNISRFIVLILIQVLILNNIELTGFINPYLYVMIILLLPLNIPKWLLLIIGFITGITIDMFSNTIGMHAAATVFMAFFRPIILNFVLDKDEFENIISPNMNEFGIKRFLTYTTFLVLIHHTVLFITETFRFTELFFTLITIILSSIFTIFLIVMSQYITKKAKKERTNIKKIQF